MLRERRERPTSGPFCPCPPNSSEVPSDLLRALTLHTVRKHSPREDKYGLPRGETILSAVPERET